MVSVGINRSHDADLERLLRLFYAKNPKSFKVSITKINIYTRKRVSQRQETRFLKDKKPGF